MGAKALEPFGGTEEGFLSYVELHSTTPRALFHVKHVKLLHELAGEPRELDGDGFVTMHEDYAEPLVKKARERLARPRD